MRWGGGRVAIFIDGKLQAEEAYEGELAYMEPKPFLLGKGGFWGGVLPGENWKNGFLGWMDEVKVYDRALSDKEIDSISKKPKH